MLNLSRKLLLPSLLHSSRRAFSASVISEPASNTTTYLQNAINGAEIFLVGTAHVSKASADEVRDTIRRIRPDSVMVELDRDRADKMRSGEMNSTPVQQDEVLKNLLNAMLTPGMGWTSRVVAATLKGVYQVSRENGMQPGQDMLAAMEEADACGATIVYGDQEQSITIRRIAQEIRFTDIFRLIKIKPTKELLAELEGDISERMKSEVEALKTRKNATTMTQTLRDVNPALAAALVDERDQIMVDHLRQLTGRVVAVVGIAHLDGIEARWKL